MAGEIFRQATPRPLRKKRMDVLTGEEFDLLPATATPGRCAARASDMTSEVAGSGRARIGHQPPTMARSTRLSRPHRPPLHNGHGHAPASEEPQGLLPITYEMMRKQVASTEHYLIFRPRRPSRRSWEIDGNQQIACVATRRSGDA